MGLLADMDKIIRVSILVFVLVLSIENTLVVSCPSGCQCRDVVVTYYTGQTGPKMVNVRCQPGLTAVPTLDAGLKQVYLSGTAASHNKIPEIKKTDFSNTNLVILTIAYSEVRTIENGAFTGHANLRDLTLSNNNLRELDAEVFNGLSALRTLDISGNWGCSFDNTLFKYLTSLEELNLGDMSIEKLDNNMFAALSKLKVLKLQLNNFQKIQAELFDPLVNIETLDLTGNKLLGLPSELKPKFVSMKSVHLSENPWQCNCQLLWLREIPRTSVTYLNDNSEIVCNGPDKLKYLSFMTVPEDEFICIPPKVVHCDATSYDLDINSRLVVSCTFDGDPIPDVKWTRPPGTVIDGYDVSDGQYHILHNGTLVVDALTMADDGDWTVSAYNQTAIDSMKIRVHVITPTTTLSTTTSLASTQTQTTKLEMTTSSSLVNTTVESNPINSDSVDKTVVKYNGINFGLLAAAAAGGGTLVGLICVCIMCCKKHHKDEENRVSPFESDV